jgi:hypothetical protein
VTKKGLISPWVKAKAEEDTVESRLRDKAKPGRTPVGMQGRFYTIMVTLPVLFNKGEDAELAARHVLGEFFSRAKGHHFLESLRRQKLSWDEKDILGPKVTFEFGPVKIHAAASSSDLLLAQALGLDRLALALTEARVRQPSVAALLKEHFLEVLRNA